MIKSESSSGLGKELLDYRKRFSITQTQVGRQLGISQVQVSRIEQGEIGIADNLIAKIQKLLRKPALNYSFNVTSQEDGFWKYSYCVFPERYSGDRILFNSKSLPDKTSLFHADAVGSDIDASANADNLHLLFECILSNSEAGLSPENIYYRLNKTLKTTRNLWRGEPSINIILAHQSCPRIEFINAGMPDILFYSGKRREIRPASSNRVPPPGALSIKEFISSSGVDVEKGDVLVSISDGFADLLKRITGVGTEEFISTFSNAYKGDPEGIATKVSKSLADSAKNQVIHDDFSFLIIARK